MDTFFKKLYLIVLILAPQCLIAQIDSSGVISGRVESVEGRAPLSGVKVEIRSISRNCMTDSDGKFTIRNLRLDIYTLEFFCQGYEQYSIQVQAAGTEKSSGIVIQLQPLEFSENITGRVIDAETGNALVDANVRLSGTMIGTVTDLQGRFSINRLAKGIYSLEVSLLGYKHAMVKKAASEEKGSGEIEIKLTTEPIKLSDFVVTPGSFSISSLQTAPYGFSKSELDVIPLGIDDPIRSIQLLPGINSDYLNAKVGIRGSEPNDALYIIDGMETYGSIFHFDRLQGSRTEEMNGLISIVNGEIIDDLNLSLGGFSGKYGNKSGGIIEIKTITPESESIHGNISLGIVKLGGLLEGNSGNNSFIFSAERGYFDLILKLFGPGTNLRPTYYDLFGKYEYKFSSGRFFFEALQSHDKINITENPSSDIVFASTNYSLNHLWAGVDFFLNTSLLSRTMVYYSYFPENTSYQPASTLKSNFSNYDKKAFLYGAKQSFTYDISALHSIELGLNVKYAQSQYSFYQTYQTTINDSLQIINAKMNPDGYDFNSYASYKIKPIGEDIVIDAGLRFDYQSYIGGGSYQLSPRISVAIQLPYQTQLRAGTGLYYQPTDITNIYTYDPQALQVAKSTHYIVGIENRMIPRTEIKIEGYYKRMPAEIKDIIIGNQYIVPSDYGYSYGVDAFLKKQFDRWYFWAGYSYGMSRDVLGDYVVFRSSDRRHSFSTNINYVFSNGWDLGLIYRFATPRPYTSQTFKNVISRGGSYWYEIDGYPNGSRGTDYSQLNLNISKKTEIAWGAFTVQLQLLNILNHQGVLEYKYKFGIINGQYQPFQDNDVDMPFLATFNLIWDF